MGSARGGRGTARRAPRPPGAQATGHARAHSSPKLSTLWEPRLPPARAHQEDGHRSDARRLLGDAAELRVQDASLAVTAPLPAGRRRAPTRTRRGTSAPGGLPPSPASPGRASRRSCPGRPRRHPGRAWRPLALHPARPHGRRRRENSKRNHLAWSSAGDRGPVRSAMTESGNHPRQPAPGGTGKSCGAAGRGHCLGWKHGRSSCSHCDWRIVM